MNFIEPTTLTLVSRALDAASLRHQAIAMNIANAHSPGARPVLVTFEQALEPVREALASHARLNLQDVPRPHLSLGTGEISIDAEMARMSSNSLHYQALARGGGRELSILGLGVQEGRR